MNDLPVFTKAHLGFQPALTLALSLLDRIIVECFQFLILVNLLSFTLSPGAQARRCRALLPRLSLLPRPHQRRHQPLPRLFTSAAYLPNPTPYTTPVPVLPHGSQLYDSSSVQAQDTAVIG